MNVTLVESSCKGEWEKLEILLKLLVILQFIGLNDFKLEETEGSGVAFPLVKSSIHSVFQDFSRTRITFSR